MTLADNLWFLYFKQTANTDLKYEHNATVKFETETETGTEIPT